MNYLHTAFSTRNSEFIHFTHGRINYIQKNNQWSCASFSRKESCPTSNLAVRMTLQNINIPFYSGNLISSLYEYHNTSLLRVAPMLEHYGTNSYKTKQLYQNPWAPLTSQHSVHSDCSCFDTQNAAKYASFTPIDIRRYILLPTDVIKSLVFE